jgi:hypothetical protein
MSIKSIGDVVDNVDRRYRECLMLEMLSVFNIGDIKEKE